MTDDDTGVTWEQVPTGHAAIHDVQRAAAIVRSLAAQPDAPLAAKLALRRLVEAAVLLVDHYGDPGAPGERLRKPWRKGEG